jgi:hypothetical protein
MNEKKISLAEARDMAIGHVKSIEEQHRQDNEEESRRLMLYNDTYIYQIGYGTMEESSSWEVRHSEHFSMLELAELVENCIVDTIKSASNKFSGTDSFQRVMDSLGFLEQLRKRGFERVDYTSTFLTFGWASCTDSSDWGSHTDEDQKAMQLRIREKLVE